MRILLHICCGPCSIIPIKLLQDAGHEIHGYFYNPNIHPLKEYMRRAEGVAQVASKLSIPIFFADPDEYDSVGWMKMMQGREKYLAPRNKNQLMPEDMNYTRCPLCWEQRLKRTFFFAQERGFEAFSSSLFYSRRQCHEEILRIGRNLVSSALDSTSFSAERGIATQLFYQDFRKYWDDGVRLSKEWEIYRQQYCGCLFSENERYAKELTQLSTSF